MKKYQHYIISVLSILFLILGSYILFLRSNDKYLQSARTQIVGYNSDPSCKISISLDPVSQKAIRGFEYSIKVYYVSHCQFNTDTIAIELDNPLCISNRNSFPIRPNEIIEDEIVCRISENIQSKVYDISVFARSEEKKRAGNQEAGGAFFTLIVD